MHFRYEKYGLRDYLIPLDLSKHNNLNTRGFDLFTQSSTFFSHTVWLPYLSIWMVPIYKTDLSEKKKPTIENLKI